MPVDYSKWDALELSDDSDIEVHPNVDKRSFIRAKQQQIHQERQQRKQQIETHKFERTINDALIQRVSKLVAVLKSHSAEAKTRNPGEIAFRAVVESSQGLNDTPPPPPAGLTSASANPSYTKMMATLLDDVNKKLEEKKVSTEDRYDAMVAELEEHLAKLNGLQATIAAKLDELEKIEARKITSESIHTGFDSSHINKTPSAAPSSSAQPELLNPNYKEAKQPDASASADKDDDDDDEEIVSSPAAKQFAQIKSASYSESLAFLGQHPEILTEKETDGILVLAFDAQLEGRDDYARNCVHQALLLQYCRALGRDGVGLFFKRITTPGHQAQGVFYKDVQETYARIRTRAREIVLQRAKDAAEGKPEGVEQIQLHAVEPGTVINIRIPSAEDPAEKEGRAIFEAFPPDLKKALESGNLEKVNKVLGKMPVEEAEEVVGKLGEAGILGIEEEIIDATTDEGKDKLKQLEEENKLTEDPE